MAALGLGNDALGLGNDALGLGKPDAEYTGRAPPSIGKPA